MKATIKRKFIDKYTKRVYKPGMEIELTEDRAEEILKKLPGAIEPVAEPEETKILPVKTEPEETETVAEEPETAMEAAKPEPELKETKKQTKKSGKSKK